MPTGAHAAPFRPALRLVVCLVLGLALCLAAVAPAGAATREQAIAEALAEARGQGRVLGVERETGADGRQVWAVKVIVGGRVRVHRVPAD